MSEKIVSTDHLSLDEALKIEGDISRFSDGELETFAGSSIIRGSSLRTSIENGELALLSEMPTSPVLSRHSGSYYLTSTHTPSLHPSATKTFERRFSDGNIGKVASRNSGSLNPASPMPTYIPEPIVKPLPRNYDLIKISNNLSKPKTNKIFAKSCTQPFGNTEACQKKESISNAFNPWGLFISSAEAMPIAMMANSEIALGLGAAQNTSTNKKAALALTKIAGKIKDKKLDNLLFTIETAPAMSIAVMLFKALQFNDDTQYTEDELRNTQEVQSRIRVHITKSVNGSIYPTVSAFHIDDTNIPVRNVEKNEQDQYSVVLEDNGPKIYWSPDESGKQVPHATPSQDDGESFSDIWVNPIHDGKYNTTTTQPMPKETDWRDAILVFPVGSGIEPLYIVYSKISSRLPRNNGKWVKGEPGNGLWLSDIPEVNKITNGEPIPFKDGKPIFDKWSKGSLIFDEGILNGTKSDFNLVYEDIAISKGLKSRNSAKNLLLDKELTPHHNTTTEIQLIPTDLHGNIPHIGSASHLRNLNNE